MGAGVTEFFLERFDGKKPLFSLAESLPNLGGMTTVDHALRADMGPGTRGRPCSRFFRFSVGGTRPAQPPGLSNLSSVIRLRDPSNCAVRPPR